MHLKNTSRSFIDTYSYVDINEADSNSAAEELNKGGYVLILFLIMFFICYIIVEVFTVCFGACITVESL